MKAWQIESRNSVRLIERKQEASPSDIKVRITRAGLSSTDVAIFEGKKSRYPIIPVRSAVGLVSEAEERSGLKKGERVVIDPYILDYDRAHRNKAAVPNVKVMGVDLDGLLCDYVSVPRGNVYPIPEGVQDNEAIFTEQIAMASRAIGAMDASRGDYVAILGANTLGNIMAQLCIYHQYVPVVIDIDPYKLKLAEKHGVYYTVNPSMTDVQQRVTEITGGKMTEFSVYEARADMVPNYIPAITQEGGVSLIVGYNFFLEKLKINLGDALEKQLRIVCIKNGYGEFNSAINYLANKIVDTGNFVDRTIAFDDVEEFVKDTPADRYVYGKVVVNCFDE